MDEAEATDEIRVNEAGCQELEVQTNPKQFELAIVNPIFKMAKHTESFSQ